MFQVPKNNDKTFLTFTLSLLLFIFCTYISLISEENENDLYPTLISAKYINGKMYINFEPVMDETLRYRLYRSTKSVITAINLIEAVLLEEISAEELPYTDIPASDGKYTYAVTIVQRGNEKIQLVPFQNITMIPINFSPFPESVERIDIEQKSEKKISIHYLPASLDYMYNLYISNKKIIELTNIKPYTELKGEDHFSVPIIENNPYYFCITPTNRLGVENTAVNLDRNTNGVPFIIKTEKPKEKKIIIVTKKTNTQLIENNLQYNFFRGSYKAALKNFLFILKNDLSAFEEATVHFYMGQCYFYLGMNVRAVRYLILSKEADAYKAPADAWMDRCLARIE